VVQSPKAQKQKDNLQGHIMAYRCTVACYVFAIKSMALDIASLLRTFGHLGVAQSTNAQVQRYTRQSIRTGSDPQ
jgi:hypothetical protein